MEDLKLIFAENLAELRKAKGLTQLGLAERINYSDKAVSKWERGESLPDVVVLKQIADLFEVTVDYLLTREHTAAEPLSKRKLHNRKMITALSAMTVLLLACILYFTLEMAAPASALWLVFLAAVPVTAVVLIVFSALWWGKKLLFLMVSVLVWSMLAFLFLAVFLLASLNIWPIFLIGIPAQIIIFLWGGLKKA